MSYAPRMLATHPHTPDADSDALVACLAACFDCAQACTACADACLAEDDAASLRHCIRQNQDCADMCIAAGRILTRSAAHQSLLVQSVLMACADACRACGDECEKHGNHGMEHCRVCAEACRACQQACETVLAKIAAT